MEKNSFEKSYVLLFMVFVCYMSTASYIYVYSGMVLLTWVGFCLNSVIFEMSLILDMVSLSYGSVVILISMSVMVFSESYMSSEQYKSRFNWLVMLFVLSMNFMIFVPNLVTMLVGWDGLGLVSFALIIYYQSVKSVNAGMLTVLINRIGDVFLLVTIVFMINLGQWGFIFMESNKAMIVLYLSVVFAGMTKSAQIPFSSWLPAAMAAPTPVSALVHSSTLVTAGVYLLIRFFPLLDSLSFMKEFLFMVGSVTMMMAGVSAMYEYDMKKIVALSTLSQLGVMILSLGVGMVELAYYHLLTHAMFKALFFVCVGSVIHCYGGSQDVRNMGTLFFCMPVTSVCMGISVLSLCGSPFLAGFYSKDLIIEMIMVSNFSIISLVFLVLGTFFTIFYSMKFLCCLFWNSSSAQKFYYSSDGSFYNLISMGILVVGSIFGGWYLSWLSFNFRSVLFLSSGMKNFIFMLTVFAFMVMLVKKDFYMVEGIMSVWVNSMWFMVPMSTQMVMGFPLSSSISLYKVFDHGWNEWLGPSGVFNYAGKMSSKFQSFQFNTVVVFLFFIMFMGTSSVMIM
uniref:NADH-ubiquinone oxidoreductase chain 5 n=1 Tax=Chaetoderma nitidulum TaxID=256131 RepID=D3G6D0_CHANT|nr:NADH dehydrogenase subunit 5 [Chaetoderma nitidulum]ABM69278.1 NADH dehydrogenase subunit 5 [Chaetoderma nitidulum]